MWGRTSDISSGKTWDTTWESRWGTPSGSSSDNSWSAQLGETSS